MRFLFFRSLVLLSSISAVGCAQNLKKPIQSESSQKPYEMMQHLTPLIGKWSMSREQTKDNGKTWAAHPKTRIEIKFKQNGLLLEQLAIDGDGADFHMAIYTSYDQYQESYRQAAIEDYWGLMDISEGQIVNGSIVFTNTKSQTYYPMENGRLRALRLTVELKAPTRYIYIDESYDDGVNWNKTFRIHYQKLP